MMVMAGYSANTVGEVFRIYQPCYHALAWEVMTFEDQGKSTFLTVSMSVNGRNDTLIINGPFPNYTKF